MLLGRALAIFQVPVNAAHRTETLAVRPADQLHRHREVNLLREDIRQFDPLAGEKPDLQLLVGYFDLLFPGDAAHRAVEEVKIPVDRKLNSRKATIAMRLQPSAQMPPDANFGTYELRCCIGPQRADLLELRCVVIQGAGLVGLRNRDPVELQLMEGYQHRSLARQAIYYSRR